GANRPHKAQKKIDVSSSFFTVHETKNMLEHFTLYQSDASFCFSKFFPSFQLFPPAANTCAQIATLTYQ
ncbi:MAG: hypothetical protein Q4D23_02975, partial [Bacteroidales bacterium]|nr:hypothetical protein [Bacteroidales bacterium]